MSKRLDRLHQQLEEIIEPVCKVHGVELVQVRVLGNKDAHIVRIYIDRDRPDAGTEAEVQGSGVSLADCTAVSRDVSAALDVEDENDSLIPGAFHLEVSSPGIERPLVRAKDFVRFAGKEIRVRTLAPVGTPPKRRFQGVLAGFESAIGPSGVDGVEDMDIVQNPAGGTIRLHIDGHDLEIPYDQVTQANLVYKF